MMLPPKDVFAIPTARLNVNSRWTCARLASGFFYGLVSSLHAVHAFVVATALSFESAVIATGDSKDVQSLAAPYRQIRVLPL